MKMFAVAVTDTGCSEKLWVLAFGHSAVEPGRVSFGFCYFRNWFSSVWSVSLFLLYTPNHRLFCSCVCIWVLTQPDL